MTIEPKAEIARLRARWSREQIASINDALIAGRLGALRLAEIEVEGKAFLDLRGLRVTAHVETRQCGLDLSHAVLDPGITVMATLRQCRFVGVELGTNVGDDVADCDFSAAAFRRATLVDRFTRCRFAGANLWKATGGQVRFNRCDFTAANLVKASLWECLFEHCTWDGCKFGGGSLADSRFVGTRPPSAALGDTIMKSDDEG